MEHQSTKLALQGTTVLTPTGWLLPMGMAKDSEGNLIRKAGIMSVVVSGGPVKPGDDIEVILPSPPFEKLDRV